jgi:hypothetical protein
MYVQIGETTAVRSMFARTSTNYIIASRVLQSEEVLVGSTPEELKVILARWGSIRHSRKRVFALNPAG